MLRNWHTPSKKQWEISQSYFLASPPRFRVLLVKFVQLVKNWFQISRYVIAI